MVAAVLATTAAAAGADGQDPGDLAPTLTGELQQIKARVSPGSVAENITSAFDPTQSYAVYLPSAYRDDAAWPVIFLMDPRGRAPVPMERFVDAAERRGYVLVSSYNTSSDTAEDVNTPAMRAMLEDTTRLFSLDEQRFYFSGFSGTARAAWGFAAQLEQYVAGIIGFGAGEHTQHEAPASARYGFYGAAGVTDFNYEEMRVLDTKLDRGDFAHRVEYFPGGHAWGPAESAARAVDWMELHAMRTGLREHDPQLVDEIYGTRLERACAMDATLDAPCGGDVAPASAGPPGGEPRVYAAWILYRALAEDFAGLLPDVVLAPVRERATELGRTDDVRATSDLHERLLRRHDDFTARFREFLQRVYDGDQDLRLRRMVRALDLESLKREAAEPSQPVEALAARRLLELVNVTVGAYEPSEYLADNEPDKAIAMLELSQFIREDDFRGWIMFARAYGLEGNAAKTVEYLERAQALLPDGLDPDLLDRDHHYDRVRNSEEFRALMERIR